MAESDFAFLFKAEFDTASLAAIKTAGEAIRRDFQATADANDVLANRYAAAALRVTASINQMREAAQKQAEVANTGFNFNTASNRFSDPATGQFVSRETVTQAAMTEGPGLSALTTSARLTTLTSSIEDLSRRALASLKTVEDATNAVTASQVNYNAAVVSGNTTGQTYAKTTLDLRRAALTTVEEEAVAISFQLQQLRQELTVLQQIQTEKEKAASSPVYGPQTHQEFLASSQSAKGSLTEQESATVARLTANGEAYHAAIAREATDEAYLTSVKEKAIAASYALAEARLKEAESTSTAGIAARTLADAEAKAAASAAVATVASTAASTAATTSTEAAAGAAAGVAAGAATAAGATASAAATAGAAAATATTAAATTAAAAAAGAAAGAGASATASAAAGAAAAAAAAAGASTTASAAAGAAAAAATTAGATATSAAAAGVAAAAAASVTGGAGSGFGALPARAQFLLAAFLTRLVPGAPTEAYFGLRALALTAGSSGTPAVAGAVGGAGAAATGAGGIGAVFASLLPVVAAVTPLIILFALAIKSLGDASKIADEQLQAAFKAQLNYYKDTETLSSEDARKKVLDLNQQRSAIQNAISENDTKIAEARIAQSSGSGLNAIAQQHAIDELTGQNEKLKTSLTEVGSEADRMTQSLDGTSFAIGDTIKGLNDYSEALKQEISIRRQLIDLIAQGSAAAVRERRTSLEIDRTILQDVQITPLENRRLDYVRQQYGQNTINQAAQGGAKGFEDTLNKLALTDPVLATFNSLLSDARTQLTGVNLSLGNFGPDAEKSAAAIESINQPLKDQIALRQLEASSSIDLNSQRKKDVDDVAGLSKQEHDLRLEQAKAILTHNYAEAAALEITIAATHGKLQETEADRKLVDQALKIVTIREAEIKLLNDTADAIQKTIGARENLAQELESATIDSTKSRLLQINIERNAIQASIPDLAKVAQGALGTFGKDSEQYKTAAQALSDAQKQIAQDELDYANEVAYVVPAAIERARLELNKALDQIEADLKVKDADIERSRLQKIGDIEEKAAEAAARIAQKTGADRVRTEEDLARKLAQAGENAAAQAILDIGNRSASSLEKQRDILAAAASQQLRDEEDFQIKLRQQREKKELDEFLEIGNRDAAGFFRTEMQAALQEKQDRENQALKLKREKEDAELELLNLAINTQKEIDQANAAAEQQLKDARAAADREKQAKINAFNEQQNALETYSRMTIGQWDGFLNTLLKGVVFLKNASDQLVTSINANSQRIAAGGSTWASGATTTLNFQGTSIPADPTISRALGKGAAASSAAASYRVSELPPTFTSSAEADAWFKLHGTPFAEGGEFGGNGMPIFTGEKGIEVHYPTRSGGIATPGQFADMMREVLKDIMPKAYSIGINVNGAQLEEIIATSHEEALKAFELAIAEMPIT